MIRQFFASVVLVASACSPVQAGQLVLNYEGSTDTNSSWGGSPIAVGTPFDIHATFETPHTFIFDTGDANYLVDSITGNVGGTPFAENSANPYYIELVDPSNLSVPGYYFVILGSGPLGGPLFEPAYLAATPALNALAPTPTTFSGFDSLGIGFGIAHEIEFDTTAGSLVLDFNTDIGINSSISSTSAVPEPSTLAMCSILLGMSSIGWCISG